MWYFREFCRRLKLGRKTKVGVSYYEWAPPIFHSLYVCLHSLYQNDRDLLLHYLLFLQKYTSDYCTIKMQLSTAEHLCSAAVKRKGEGEGQQKHSGHSHAPSFLWLLPAASVKWKEYSSITVSYHQCYEFKKVIGLRMVPGDWMYRYHSGTWITGEYDHVWTGLIPRLG